MHRLEIISNHLVVEETKVLSNSAQMSESVKKSSMSSHILDTSTGKPAKGLKAKLEKWDGVSWGSTTEHQSDADGRIKDFPALTEETQYRITFDTEGYFKSIGVTKYFYPHVSIVFQIAMGEHYHVPLLISPFGYSTYRGS